VKAAVSPSHERLNRSERSGGEASLDAICKSLLPLALAGENEGKLARRAVTRARKGYGLVESMMECNLEC
jgi:hypothetical protein